MDIHGFVQSAIPLLTVFGLKVVGAIILWVIGRKLIGFARVLIVRSLKAPFDQTVATYIGTAVSVTLTLALIIALLSFFGVETTSFAALLAGVGIAIGAASGAVIGFLSTILGGRRAPSAAYTNFVDRCLRERGYEPTGWQ